MISTIKSFEDLLNIVFNKDGYLNVYSVISITKKLIKEMIVHITTKYSPENIDELNSIVLSGDNWHPNFYSICSYKLLNYLHRCFLCFLTCVNLLNLYIRLLFI